jgi:hypothetical protein
MVAFKARGIAMERYTWVGLLVVAGITGFVGAGVGQRTYAATLPVYEVTQQGATDEQLKKLSEALKVPVARLGTVNGPVSLTDTAAFLAIPKRPVADAIRNKLLAAAPQGPEPRSRRKGSTLMYCGAIPCSTKARHSRPPRRC